MAQTSEARRIEPEPQKPETGIQPQHKAAEKTGIWKKFIDIRIYDRSLLLVIFLLLCFGFMMVYSSSYYTAQLKGLAPDHFLKKQLMSAAIGAVMMMGLSLIGYKWIRFLLIPGYMVCTALMALVNFTRFGIEVNGQKRWFGVDGRAIFQPSELVKVFTIVALAFLICKLGREIDRLWKMFVVVLILMIPGAMVLDKNLSTGLTIIGIIYIMLFAASSRKKLFLYSFLGAAAAFVLVYIFADQLGSLSIMKGYRFDRILAWRHPTAYAADESYQVLQGLYAIGNGGLFGRGLGNGTQKLGFVPECYNDMIFSIICEELGLLGGLFVIGLYGYLIYRLLMIAVNVRETFGRMIVIGAMAHISLQVIFNVAVVTNSMPNTGITLPFISYGGTSVIFLLCEMGLVLAVARTAYLKDDKHDEK